DRVVAVALLPDRDRVTGWLRSTSFPIAIGWPGGCDRPRSRSRSGGRVVAIALLPDRDRVAGWLRPAASPSRDTPKASRDTLACRKRVECRSTLAGLALAPLRRHTAWGWPWNRPT